MALLTTLVAGVVFGLALAAPPGPMNAVIAEESVLRGWSAGFRAGLGAMSADVCFFFLALAGVVSVVRDVAVVQGVMVAVGGVLMLYFAYGAVRDALASSGFSGDEASSDGKGFRKAFVLALTNPYQIVFWLTVGVGLLDPGRIDVVAEAPILDPATVGSFVVETGSPALIVGMFAGVAVWITGFPATLVTIGRRTDRFAPAVAAASGLVLAGFGVYFLADAVRILA